MNAIVFGAMGRMGQQVLQLIGQGSHGVTLAAAVDKNGSGEVYQHLDDFHGKADVIIDFSWHAAVGELLSYACATGTPVMIATTGHTERELAMIRRAARRIPIFHTANMSVGVALLCELAKKTAAVFPGADIEIVEAHHNRKVDAPSGTALMLAKELEKVRPDAAIVAGRAGQHLREKNEIGIHAIRAGNIIGIHEIIIATEQETITLKHEAHDRSLFANGALAAAAFLVSCEAGLYSMEDMLR